MHQQLSLLDWLASEGDSEELPDLADEFDSEMAIRQLREDLLIKSVREAFGMSTNGKQNPVDSIWEWMLSRDKKQPFSFDNCCEEFGADPETVLDLLKIYKNKLLG